MQQLSPAAAHQVGILQRMGVPAGPAAGTRSFNDVDVIIDAMVGYSLRGPLRGVPAEICPVIAASEAAVVSLDMPSGTSADHQDPGGLSVRADTTVTLCLPKQGLRDNPATGRLLLADISVPSSVVEAVIDGPPPPFRRGPILELSDGNG
jgi:NAD(P)H-hydrate epimerase